MAAVGCDCSGLGLRRVVDGDRVAMVACDCRIKLQTARRLAAARIPDRYGNCTLDTYAPAYAGANRSLEAAKAEAVRFGSTVHSGSGRGLLFTGSIGVGKTHLAVGTLKMLQARKVGCLFVGYRELISEIRATFSDGSGTSEREVLRPILEAEVLVLDELGAAKPSEWVWDTIALVLNTRYNERRSTIVTTNYANLPPCGNGREETLGDRVGERMRSRLQEMCVAIEMQGSDFRQGVKRAR